MTYETYRKKICCICSKVFQEWGNNPDPIKKEGVCCDKCDKEKVIPARLEQEVERRMNNV